jgi:arsenate reductase
MNLTAWINPKCGTCQKVLTALRAKGYEPTVIEYLKTPPSIAEIDAVCRKLGVEPHAIARQKEPIYAAIAARCKTRQDWLSALHENPVLIERPIVFTPERAVIARPPEKLDSFLA